MRRRKQASLPTFDTSAVLALSSSSDTNHQAAAMVASTQTKPLVLPAEILAEVTFMLDSRAQRAVTIAFLWSIAHHEMALDSRTHLRLPRIIELLRGYADSTSMDFADAAVIACAEQNDRQVFAFDHRDFGPAAREGLITIIP